MKLFLSQVTDRRWSGLVEIDQETFKVTLIPGSATTDWEAVLEVGGWVELTPDTKLIQAIERSLIDWERGVPPQEQAILEALKEHPELLEEIVNVLKGEPS